jgi:hypothetical protein
VRSGGSYEEQPKDLPVTRGGARRVKGGAKKVGGPSLTPPSPPSGPLPIPYPI